MSLTLDERKQQLQNGITELEKKFGLALKPTLLIRQVTDSYSTTECGVTIVEIPGWVELQPQAEILKEE